MPTNETTSNRIAYLDFMKFIGLTCIILAHVDPPEGLFMVRNFDVQLMVIISAILGQKTYKKYTKTTFSFCADRVKRLVYPVWIFLFGFFALMFLAGNVYSGTYYFHSFLLTRYGIGYVWVVLIYIYCALLIPLCNKTATLKHLRIYVVAIYLFYEIMCYFEIGTDIKLIESTFYYIIPYSVLTYLGFNYHRFQRKEKTTIIVMAAIIFIVFGVLYWKEYGAFQDVQIAKYPPRAYYLSYGILVTFILLSIFEKCKLHLYRNKVIVFISKHSMWIYLWHILAVYLYGYLNLPDVWYIKFVLIYLGALMAVMVVNKALDIMDKKQEYGFLKYFRY